MQIKMNDLKFSISTPFLLQRGLLAFLIFTPYCANSQEVTQSPIDFVNMNVPLTPKQWNGSSAWQFRNGQIVCPTKPAKNGHVLSLSRALPTNGEIEFEWRNTLSADDAANGSLFIQYGRGDVSEHFDAARTSIDYFIEGLKLRLTVASSLKAELGSGGFSGSPYIDYSRQAGEWNRSRVIYQGTRLQFWLNGNIVYDLDVAKERDRFQAGGGEMRKEDAVIEQALSSWIDRGKQPVTLSLIGAEYELPENTLVQIRSLVVKERSTNAELFSSPRINDLNIKSHKVFSALSIPANKLKIIGVIPSQPALLASSSELVNPGATKDESIIQVHSKRLIPNELTVGKVTAFYRAEYRVESESKTELVESRALGHRDAPREAPLISVVAWEFADARDVTAFAAYLRSTNGRITERQWALESRKCVVLVITARTVSDEILIAVRDEIQKSVDKIASMIAP